MENNTFDFDTTPAEQQAVIPQQTVDENGNIIGDSFTKKMSPQEAMTVSQILDQMGMADKYAITMAEGKASMTITDITDEQLARLQRKINIANWSRATIKIAKTVTNFAADIADYTLNGAVAPTAVAVADAAITTGRVVGTAAVKAGAGVAASAFRNGRAAVNEVWNSSEIRDCGNEMKKCWSGIAGKLFGSSADTASGWNRVSA